ncbi:hypothetical protein LJC58_07885 [Lachnospiraceae bacterium OttesenSCG-928-D06]|nr:hypothetical protein [Lachnospiraceae bacterium OttesenSCG-928-D06]
MDQSDIDQGLLEKKVGLELEKSGKLSGSIIGDPSGNAEFFDVNGQAWDVKSFNSNIPPKKGRFTLERAMDSINDSLLKGENVILDTTNLSDADKVQLLQEIANQDLSDKIIT